jgi:hypothetical protein
MFLLAVKTVLFMVFDFKNPPQKIISHKSIMQQNNSSLRQHFVRYQKHDSGTSIDQFYTSK